VNREQKMSMKEIEINIIDEKFWKFSTEENPWTEEEVEEWLEEYA
jgi:hypothetical protein